LHRRQASALIANDLQYRNPPLNRRNRNCLFRATAALSLAVWLFMAAAELCTPLHAWLHGGTIPDDDDCAIACIAHGKIETAPVAVPAAAPVVWIEVTPRIEFSVLSTAIALLPNDRAPPVFSAVS
jgi:hypothetical protein